MVGDPIKDRLYYSVSEYERKLNPGVTEAQVSEKASYARNNPEQYFSETYKKITGKNIDEATINRINESGFNLDVNKLPKDQVNFVDNDQRELIELHKKIDEVNQELGIDINASEREVREYFDKNIYPKQLKSAGANIGSYEDRFKEFMARKEAIKERYGLLSQQYEDLYEKNKNALKPVEIDKFFKDAEKVTKGDLFGGNDAREQRQNANLDSERYFNILAKDFYEKQAQIKNPVEQEMAGMLMEGKAPEMPEGFQASPEFKDFLKSFENLAKQRDINVDQFGSEITKGKKLTYNEQLEERQSILQEDRDLTQNWFLKGSDSYRGKGVPSITRTWVNRAALNLVDGATQIGDPLYYNSLEKKAAEALKNNDYNLYLKYQRELSLKDFVDEVNYVDKTLQRTDVTAPVWEKFVEVDGHRIAIDGKGNVQRVVNNKGFTVHNLSKAEQEAVAKYQANPGGYKPDEGFSKSAFKSIVNMAGGSAVEMIPMIVGGMATSPLRALGTVGNITSGVVSSAPMFTSIYGQEFKEHFNKTGDWNTSSLYASLMAGTESLAEWAGGRVERRFADAFSGRPVRDVIIGAGRRAADAAVNAKNLANFSFVKEFVKQLAIDIGQEEAEEIFTMFAQHGIDKAFGNESEIDMNEVLSTVLVTPLATAPFSLVTNSANYKTPGAYRDMVNSAADNYEKTMEIFSEMGAQLTLGKSEKEAQAITNELKGKMDLVKHVRDKKDYYAGNVGFKGLDFTKEELEAVEHYIFEEAIAKTKGKEVDFSEKINPIINAARKRGVVNSVEEKEDPIIEDANEVEEEFVKPFSLEDDVQEEVVDVQEEEVLESVPVENKKAFVPTESQKLARRRYDFNSKKDKDGFVTRKTIGKDGQYETISNDFDALNGNNSLNYNVDISDAQNISLEAIDILRQTGIRARIDVAEKSNVTDVPLKITFENASDAKTFHDLMQSSGVYTNSRPAGITRSLGHRVDDKVQFSSGNFKDISKAQDVFNNATQDEDGSYMYFDNGDFISFTNDEINRFASIIDSPKNEWENASVNRFSETVEPIQFKPAPAVGGNNGSNTRLDQIRNPLQVETRKEEAGVQRLNGKTDSIIGSVFDFQPGERKEVEVFKNGKRGVLSVDQGGKMVFENADSIIDVGNISENYDKTFEELGFKIPNSLGISKKGHVLVGGRIFINPYSHAEGAINLNEDGGIESVDVVEKLPTGQLVRREFTGQMAIDMATALVVNEVKFNEDYKKFFENYTPTIEDTRFIPSRLTIDRLAAEIEKHIPGRKDTAWETAKMYFFVANREYMKNPGKYSKPAEYIIDRVLSVDGNIEDEITDLVDYLDYISMSADLSPEEAEDLRYEIEKIKRVRLDDIERIETASKQNALVEEIKSLPLTHVSIDPVNGLGMGENEMLGTYLSTETGGNRYMTEHAISKGAELYDAVVDIENPFDLEESGEDIVSIVQRNIKKAVSAYIYDNQLEGDMVNLAKQIEYIDDPLIENFPGMAEYISREVTQEFIDKGYDSFYSRSSDTTEGYLVVFDKSKVSLKKKTVDLNRPGTQVETLEDFQEKNGQEWNKLLLGNAEQRRKDGMFSKDGLVYRRKENLPGEYGKKGSVYFAMNPSVEIPFTYKLVNIFDLSPSHIGGRLNPYHFIPEAQPKDRSGKDTSASVQGFAHKPKLNQIVYEAFDAYSGFPVVNKRGEVIQGNNRTEGLQLGYTIKNRAVRDGILNNLELFGFTMEQAEKIGLDNLFIVRELATNDNMSIELGNYEQKDMETGNKRLINPVSVSNRLSFETKGDIFNKLFLDYDNQTLNELVRNNAQFIYDKIAPILNSAIINTIITDGKINQDGISGFEAIVNQFLFDGADQNVYNLYQELPYIVKTGIERALPYIFSSGRDKSLVPDIQNAILAFSEYRRTGLDFQGWANQRDIFNGGMANKELYSPLEMKLAEIFDKANKQDDIIGKTGNTNFFLYSALTREKADSNQITIDFGEEEKSYTKEQAVFEAFKVPYNDRARKQIEGEPVNQVENRQTDTGSEEAPVREEDVTETGGGRQDTQEVQPGNIVLNKTNGKQGDIVFNQNGDRFEIFSLENGVYEVYDKDGVLYKLNPDMGIFVFQSDKQVDVEKENVPSIVLGNAMDFPEYNVSVILTPVEVQEQLPGSSNYQYKADIYYPVGNIAGVKDTFYFETMPAESDMNTVIEEFIQKQSEALAQKEDKLPSEEKTVKSIEKAIDKLLERNKSKAEEKQSIIQPIGQLGTGANVYFETEKYRVNDNQKDGGYILNVNSNVPGEVIPIANIPFDDILQAMVVAGRLQRDYPKGVPEALFLEKYIQDIINEPESKKELLIKAKENPVVFDQVLYDLGIDFESLITFTDENGNPCK